MSSPKYYAEYDQFRVTTSTTEDLWSSWDCTGCHAGDHYMPNLRASQQAARRHTLKTSHKTEVTSQTLRVYEKKVKANANG